MLIRDYGLPPPDAEPGQYEVLMGLAALVAFALLWSLLMILLGYWLRGGGCV